MDKIEIITMILPKLFVPEEPEDAANTNPANNKITEKIAQKRVIE